jgi:hypothetical protein
MAKVPHCVKVYRENLEPGLGNHQGDPRGLKKFFRKQGMMDLVYNAYQEGLSARSPINPYPTHATRRRKAWQDGYKTSAEAQSYRHNGRFWA